MPATRGQSGRRSSHSPSRHSRRTSERRPVVTTTKVSKTGAATSSSKTLISTRSRSRRGPGANASEKTKKVTTKHTPAKARTPAANKSRSESRGRSTAATATSSGGTSASSPSSRCPTYKTRQSSHDEALQKVGTLRESGTRRRKATETPATVVTTKPTAKKSKKIAFNDKAAIMKDRKYSTRYGPNAETTDQEGDSPDVTGPTSASSLVREMKMLNSSKSCRLVLWGLKHCQFQVSDLVRSDLLVKWLEHSCNHNLHDFLVNLEAYCNMKTVTQILDIMLQAGGNQSFRFEERIVDLSFIENIKASIKAQEYGRLTIENMVAWLALIKVSMKAYSIRNQVVPPPEEMVYLIQSLHSCVVKENSVAKREGRDEDISPIMCLVIALFMSNYMAWEEGYRRQMTSCLEKILLDPMLDEKLLIIQAMHTLHELVDEVTFEEVMLPLLQDVFDMKSDRIKEIELSRKDMDLNESSLKTDACSDASVARNSHHLDNNMQVGKVDEVPVAPTPPPPQTPIPPSPVLLTAFQLMGLKDKICQLGIQRLQLENEKEELIKQKSFLATIPINEEIIRVHDEEMRLKAELEVQKELAKHPPPPPSPPKVATPTAPSTAPPPPPPPEESHSPIPSTSASFRQEAQQVLNAGRKTLVPVLAQSRLEESNEDNESRRGSSDASGPRSSRQHHNEPGGVVCTVEEGLAKALIMLNSYMDYKPEMSALIRNIYDNYISVFMAETDPTVRNCVLQLLTRIALAEKRQLRPVASVLYSILDGRLQDCTEGSKSIAYRSIVDLVIAYAWKDFLLEGNESELELQHQSIADFTSFLGSPYESATDRDMRDLFITVILNYKPLEMVGSEHFTVMQAEIVTMIKYQGLLKLFLSGKFCDPSHLSRVLIVWVNLDYSGTMILKDLRTVLKSFKKRQEMWAKDQPELDDGWSELVIEVEGENSFAEGEEEENERRPHRASKLPLRLLGKAFVLAIVDFCKEVGRAVSDVDMQDRLVKFIQFGLRFLDHQDQSLMRTMTTDLLNEIIDCPTRSWNPLFVRCVAQIPIMSRISATQVVNKLDDCYASMREHPMSKSMVALKQELKYFGNKLQRIFGGDIMDQVEKREPRDEELSD